MGDVPSKQSKIEIATLFAKAVAAVFSAIIGSAAIFYVIGFVIVNLYLASLGIRNLEFRKPEYLSAGISFLLANSLPIFVTGALEKVYYNTIFIFKKSEYIKEILSIVLIIFIFIAVEMFFLKIITEPEIVLKAGPAVTLKFLADYKIYMITLFFFVIYAKLFYLKNFRVNNNYVLAFSSYLIVNLLFLLVTWSLTVYPRVQPAFGGGQPVKIQLLAKNQEAVKIFKSSGIPFEDNLKTINLKLVDENDNSIIVLSTSSGAIKLDRALISSIVYNMKTDNK